jgi:hypothetical protein
MSLPMQEITVRVRAVAAGLGESDNENKTKFVHVTGCVVDDEQFNGEQITAVLYFTEKTSARSVESLIHFGFASDDLSLLEEAGEARCAELLPDVVEFVCAPEEYKGEWQLKVKWVNKPGRGKFAPKKKLEGSDLKAFAAQMKGALKNARGGAPRQPSTNQQSRQATTGGSGWGGNGKVDPKDDIPFATCEPSAEPSPIARVLR